ATQVECTINGIGERAGNASLEEIVMGITTRPEYYGVSTGVNTKEIYKSAKLISSITGVAIAPNKAIVGANAFAHEAGIHQHGVLANKETYEIMTPASIGIPEQQMVLGKHSGRHAFEERLVSLGYQLDKEEINTVFEQFKNLADKKKIVTDKDILALVANKARTEEHVYKLDTYTINSGNTITATATVKVINGETVIEEVAIGDGPIDAAFKAINKITKKEFVLDDYVIHAVTGGEDALGEAVVKLSYDGQQFTGRAISTDIIQSSVEAYINGVNKHLY
ncbi:MAG: alpha-isopropylmalate synthase regulatory domain-containing protein, partial [Clostridia bacterium]